MCRRKGRVTFKVRHVLLTKLLRHRPADFRKSDLELTAIAVDDDTGSTMTLVPHTNHRRRYGSDDKVQSARESPIATAEDGRQQSFLPPEGVFCGPTSPTANSPSHLPSG